MAHARAHRHSQKSSSIAPLIAFLLVASFGILFAGCSKVVDQRKDFVFTAEDAVRFRELARQAELELRGDSGSGSIAPLAGSGTLDVGSGSALAFERTSGGSGSEIPVLDLALANQYKEIRTAPVESADAYRVTNAFVNLRAAPTSDGAFVGRIEGGTVLHLLEFIDAAWAKVKTDAGVEGFVSSRYIAKITSTDALPLEKKKFENVYYVNFAFLNVRAAPDQGSAKLGELPSQAFVRPIAIANGFAKILFQGKEAYVSTQYLSSFMPSFIARQNSYTVPVLFYHWGQSGIADSLAAHVALLKQSGMRFISMRDFYDTVLAQEKSDVRVPDRSVILAIDNVRAQDVASLLATLSTVQVKGTIFVQTQHVGLSGITEKLASQILAAGIDLQSQGHTGDDLRSLTNAQLSLELRQSRRLLEELTNASPIFAIAYPQGGVNDRVSMAAEEAGYLFGIGSIPDRTFSRGELLRMPSYSISSGMSAEDVLRIAQG